MSEEIRLKPLAQEEFQNAVAWYERKGPGLGARFAAAVKLTFDRIRADPELFPQVRKGVRKAKVHVFPYTIYFVVGREAILVIAVHHGARDPKALGRRLK